MSADEIDQALLRIAMFNPGSSIAVQSLKEQHEAPPDRIEVLEGLYLRLQPREAKWLTRIILKNFGLVTLPGGFPVPGNVTHLPNSLPVMLNFPNEPPTPKRRTRTRVKRGVGSNKPDQPLPTPPTSSPNLLHPETAAVAEKPAPRYRIGWDPESSTLSASIKVIAHPAQPGSSSLPTSSKPRLASPPISSLPTASIPTKSLPPRKALGQISTNIPSGGSQSQQSQSRSQEKNTPARHPTASSDRQRSPTKTPSKHTPKSPVVFSTGKCLLTRASPPGNNSHSRCQFSSCLLILSPCLQSHPHLLNTLIPTHGAHYLTSLLQLSHPTVPRRTKSGRRVKRFILVDITRPEKAVRFCQEVERAVGELVDGGVRGWRTKGGRKERIPIFDWRVLESAAKWEKGVTMEYDVLEKHFQGVI